VDDITPESTSYIYDEYSNRKSMSVAGEQAYSVEYNYDKSNRLKTEIKTSGGNIETTSYKYDYNGNQTEKAVNGTKVWSGDYNGFNELTKVVDNGVTALYKYDGNGLRISKTVDGVTTNHIWDGAQIVLDMDASWNLISKYTRGLNLIYREGEYGRNREYYVFNGHGDVVQLTDSNGNVVRTYDYDAFGVENSPDEADTNPFRYCGEYWDKIT
jgi:YD repeat-containing protein